MHAVLIMMLVFPGLGMLTGAVASEAAVGRRLVFGLVLLNLGAGAALALRVSFGPAFADLGPRGLALVGDRLGALFAMLAAGIQLTVLSYAARCLEGPVFRRFLVASQALLFASELTGLAGTFATLVLGWVMASIAVYALVAHTAAGRGSTRQLAFAFLIGDAALAGALAITWQVAGNAAWSDLGAVAAVLRGLHLPLGPVALPADDAVALLIVVAAIVRSALWPGPRWLPATLAAPTPVSALLHAGVVNAGGILLIRLSPLLVSTPGLPLALAAGLATAAMASVASAVRSDVKGALVHSTMSQMGFMVAECAVGAYALAAFHLVAHGMYKASLFLNSGDGIAATVRQRQSSALAALSATRLRLTGALLGAAGLVALAMTLGGPSGQTAHGGSVLAVPFAAVTSGALVWGWLKTKPSLGEVVRAGALCAFGAAAYLLWSSGVSGWLLAGTPVSTAGAPSPWWLVAGLVGAGSASALAACAAPPRLLARLHARALWASWKTPSPGAAGSVARPDAREVVWCKESV
jgi:NADH:ubiquinone oxidoreductase subunit 5 (subunit L)/multisubunit Na+/H+ antiporter MnhA subunit